MCKRLLILYTHIVCVLVIVFVCVCVSMQRWANLILQSALLLCSDSNFCFGAARSSFKSRVSEETARAFSYVSLTLK